MRIVYRCVILVFAYSLTTVAEQPPTGKTTDLATEKTPVTGTVTGHVYLNDTKAPARKGTVYLQPVAALLVDAPPGRGNSQDGGTTISVEVLFDGSYSFTHVPNGSYYVIASCPGYVSPYLSISLAGARTEYSTWQPLGPTQKAEKERVLRSLPRVDVQSTLPAVIDLVVERGAAVSGTITYDDGGPAAGLEVDILARMIEDGKETWSPFDMPSDHLFHQLLTDDRGNYRISGLPARKYVVVVHLMVTNMVMYISSSSRTGGTGSNAHTANLSIYSGGTPRLKDASPFTVEAGEERTGEDLRIPISKLHTVRGNIVSAQDGHIINGGRVLLLNADDNSLAGNSGPAEDDPDFIFYFVYDGEYILTSPMSADSDPIQIPQIQDNGEPPTYSSKPRHFYGGATKPLHVAGDMEGVTIAVPEPTAAEAQILKEALRQQEQQNQSGGPR
jgi:hypothetical protein